MVTNDVSYNSTIENWIIANLDGWTIEDPTPGQESENDNGDVNPFMTTEELEHKANKVITSTECQLFYEETLDMAYVHTNRLNIDDLTEIEARIFLRAVCKWTASNLWNKYNIRVNNEDMEDTYVQSYGGLLYASAMKTLQPFIIQTITNMSSIPHDNNNNHWIV